MKKIFLILSSGLLTISLSGQLTGPFSGDTLLGRSIIRDNQQRILGWYKPEIPGAVYDKVIRLSSEFLKNIPVEPSTGLPMYLVTCCFRGPQFLKPGEIIIPDWPHNPACVFAGMVHSLAVRYYAYIGDNSYLKLVKSMLDHQLAYGTTPDGWKWPGVPYASADPLSKVYQGATKWENDGMRGDGLHGIEPDKVGELGYAYLQFYEVTCDEKYLQAAVKCADALAGNIRDIKVEDVSPKQSGQSPWPFRLNARSGVIISEYCSNVLEAVKLFNELVRIQEKINLSEDKIDLYEKASSQAWEWFYSLMGPMVTFIWNAYFEDVTDDPEMSNRVQITPIEVAKYLILNPGKAKNISTDVPSLILWVANAFKTDGLDAIKEQSWCYYPMGSHTARYGSACAMYYEFSGDPWYKDQAYRFLNVASYMTHENGVVSIGPGWIGSWFSDGYSDYIRHFIDAMASCPEWAPEDEDHLLRSTSVIQNIVYQPDKITFTTFDENSEIVIRLSSKPGSILVNDKEIKLTKITCNNSWTWSKLDKGGVVRLKYSGGNHVIINK